MNNRKPKIVILDIETAPITGQVWGLFKQNLGLEQIVNDQSILSYAAKTVGVKGVRYESVEKNGVGKYSEDRELCEKLWHEIDKADFIVAHNGKKFDMRKINARFIFHGFVPPSPVVVIDTLLELRQVAAFTSAKLAFLTEKLTTEKKMAHAQFPGFTLWKECLLGNAKAWAEMRKYNKQDVISLEELYLKTRMWYVGHPSVAVYLNNTTPTCPCCGSTDLEQHGYHHTRVNTYDRYVCNDCGRFARGRFTVRALAQRRATVV